jgi:CRP-like cAMP-binding protein
MVEAGLSKTLRRRVEFYQERHIVNHLALLRNVCQGLPTDLSAELKLRAFSRALFRNEGGEHDRLVLNPLLRGLSRGVLTKLLNTMEMCELMPREIVWTKGDPPTGILFILSGALQIVHVNNDTILATLYTGCFCGENLLVHGHAASPFAVRALSWTNVILLKREDIASILEAEEEDSSWMSTVARVRYARFLTCVKTSLAIQTEKRMHARRMLSARSEHVRQRSNLVDMDTSMPSSDSESVSVNGSKSGTMSVPGSKTATMSVSESKTATMSDDWNGMPAPQGIKAARLLNLFETEVYQCGVLIEEEDGVELDANAGMR